MVMIVSIFTIIPVSASAEETKEKTTESSVPSEATSDTEFEANVEFVEATELEKPIDTETKETSPTKIGTIAPSERKSIDIAPVGETVNGFTYSVSNKEATITAYNNKTVASLTIPEKSVGIT